VKDFTSVEGDPVASETAHQQVTSAVSDGWIGAGSLTATILSAFLIGYLLDKWWGTDPWFTVFFIIVGFVGGFFKMMAWYKEQSGI
jgi:F0F1-type ATP synthase assembly protein I